MIMNIKKEKVRVLQAIGNMDHQGIMWNLPIDRKKQLARRKINFTFNRYKRNKDLPAAKPKYEEQFYQVTGFHSLNKMRESHFQSKYTLAMGSISNLLLHSYKNQLIVYDSGKQIEGSLDLSQDRFKSIGICVQNTLCAIPGMSSDLIVINLENMGKDRFTLSQKETFINHAQFHENYLIVCDNDHNLQVYDYQEMKQLVKHTDKACINLFSVNKDKLIAYCADRLGISVYDYRINKIVMNLEGHVEFGFTVDFNPVKQYELASGSEDQSCLIFDIRNPKQPFEQLFANTSPIYNLSYTSDGQHLFIGETYDNIHIVESQNYQGVQTIDFFGSQSGITIDPQNQDQMYFSVSVEGHEGIFQVNRNQYKFDY